MLAYLATLGSALSLFTVWDLLLERAFLHKISWYLFGYEKMKFGNFCYSIMSFLLGGFIKENRIHKTRVYLFSAFLFVVILHKEILQIAEAASGSAVASIAILPIFILIAAAISFPFDVAQLAVAKRLFYRKVLTGQQFLVRFISYFVFCAALVGPILFCP